MRRFASIILAAVGFASLQPALAADIAARAPLYKAPAVPVAYNWSGFYAGVNVGYGWGDGAIDLVPHNPAFTAGVLDVALANGIVPASLATNPRGALGGLQAGYNVQSGAFVWGIEADIAAAAIKGSSTAVSPALPFWPTFMTTQAQKVDWLGTVRGRIGATVTPDWLLYVTGGLAYGHGKASTSIDVLAGGGPCANNIICSAGSVDGWRVGWTVGGGSEYHLASNWSVKAEYLYYDLGSAKYTFFNPQFPFTPGPDRGFDATANFRGHIARVGLNYKFDSGAVVAKY